jgi:two-component system nitrate/nitrite response regulator NarL
MAEDLPQLAPIECEAAALAASGLSNKQIARVLGFTEGMVKQHLHRVYVKLGVQRHGLLVLGAARLRQSTRNANG